MSVINSMPAAWRLLIRTANIAPVLSPLPNTLAIAKDREKLSAKYHHLTIDWKRVYLLSFRTTLETKYHLILMPFYFDALS